MIPTTSGGSSLSSPEVADANFAPWTSLWGRTLLPYDYNSLMHYPAHSMSSSTSASGSDAGGSVINIAAPQAIGCDRCCEIGQMLCNEKQYTNATQKRIRPNSKDRPSFLMPPVTLCPSSIIPPSMGGAGMWGRFARTHVLKRRHVAITVFEVHKNRC